MKTILTQIFYKLARKSKFPWHVILSATLTRNGIEFAYKGDWVWWLYPWDRKWNNGNAFVSTLFCGSFHSLKQIDDEWQFYSDAMNPPNESIGDV